LANQPKSLSELAREIDVYCHDAEVNTKVSDIPATLARVKTAYADGRIDETDGITVEYDDWWFNLRPSNTEPLIRLSIEAKTQADMVKRRTELLKIIQS
jgi:phosphomannomutase